MGTRGILLVLVSGCGRLSFDATPVEQDPPDGALPGIDSAPVTSRCAESPGLHCDGFESGNLGAWRAEVGAGTVDVVGGDAFLGDFSMRASASSGGFAYAAVDLTPLSGGPVYIRAMIRFGGTTIDAGEALQFMRIGAESDVGHVHVLITDQRFVQVYPNGPIITGTTAVPSGQWLCVRLDMELGNPGIYALSVDDTLHAADSTSAIESAVAGYAELSIGIVSTGGSQQPFAIDFDEVRIGTTPLACD